MMFDPRSRTLASASDSNAFRGDEEFTKGDILLIHHPSNRQSQDSRGECSTRNPNVFYELECPGDRKPIIQSLRD